MATTVGAFLMHFSELKMNNVVEKLPDEANPSLVI